MKYKIVMSSVLLTLLNTGCVKPTEEINGQKEVDTPVIYDETPTSVTYDDSTTPIVYGDPTATTTTETITSTATTTPTTVISGSYETTIGDDGTVIATDHYQPQASTIDTNINSSGAYGTPPPSNGGEIYNSIDDPYTATPTNNPYATNNSYNSNPYTGGSSSRNNSYHNSYNNNPYTPNNSYHRDDPYTYSDDRSYSNHSNNRYTTNTDYSSTGGGGIQLQVAALRDYYAAEEFKNNLSLDPKYSVYIKKGPINKVIITGISTRAEAKALAARQFPGAFIVSGSSSSSPSYSSSSYTTNTSYHSHSSTHSSRSGIGVQVGAFSSREKAKRIAREKAGGKYKAIVKTAKIRGRTIYKAIIVGFSSRAEAKRAIASGRFGDAFVVSGVY